MLPGMMDPQSLMFGFYLTLVSPCLQVIAIRRNAEFTYSLFFMIYTRREDRFVVFLHGCKSLILFTVAHIWAAQDYSRRIVSSARFIYLVWLSFSQMSQGDHRRG